MTYNSDASILRSKDEPHTDPKATVVATRVVTGARVAVIDRVFFRGAEFGGAFELDNNPLCYVGSTPKLKVRITWFGRTPEAGVCEITPLSAVLFEGNYHGEVVDDIGRRDF
jgi:hypothetical protein